MRLLTSFLLVAVVALSACDKAKVATPTVTPTITLFAADSLTVKSGTAAILRWDCQPATADIRIDPQVGAVPVSGSVALILTATTTFTLNARIASGAAVQRTLTVVVLP